MSYILEALRKAEAERERGLVPGLHARASAAPDVVDAPGAARLRTWAPWAVAGVSAVVAAVFAWTWHGGLGEQVPAGVATMPSPAAPAVSPPPATVATAAAGPSFVPSDGSATASALPSTGVAVPRLAAPVATTRPVAVAARATAPASVGIAASPAAIPAVAPPTVATTDPASSPADHRVYTLAELPEATRRELPALSIAGASYSEHPANRLLIVNGNVFHEGDRLAPDLLLERIDLKSAVLRHKDLRFSVTY